MLPGLPLHRRSLGAYLALAFAALSTVLTLILVGVIGVTAGDQVRKDIGDSLAELARQTADKLDRDMFERYREVRLIAQRFDSSDQPGARRFLGEVRASYPYYAWIGAAGSDGAVEASTNGMLEGVKVGQRPWYRNALNGVHVGDVHEAVLLAKLLPNPGKEPLRFVDVAFPYFARDGEVAGVLGAHLSWQWAADVTRSVIQPRQGQRGMQALILGADNVVLLGPPDIQGKRLDTASARAPGAGSVIESWPDGKRYLVGFSKSAGHADYPGLGWKVLVRQDAETAFEPVAALQEKVLWSGIAVAVVFSLFGVWIARYISAPLKALSEAAAHVRQGRALQMPDRLNEFDEVRTLARSLSSLVTDLLGKEAALTELNQTLEKRVESRTAELAAALADVRESEARIHAILEASQDAFVGIDLNGAATDWNASAEKMFGLTEAEAIGRQVSELIVPQRLRQRFDQAIAQFSASGKADFTRGRIELQVCDRSGREFPVETTVGLAGNSRTAFFSAFLHDISQRKQVERMKSEFVSTVSHELRTPITAIRFSLSMLADGSMGAFDKDVQKLLDIAHDSCERLVRLINDILDIEKMESGQMEYDFVPQPMLDIARGAVEATRAYAAQFNVRLRVESDGSNPTAALDRDRMTQVVVNLLSNAVKFSPDDDQVVVRVETRAESLRLSVSDRGNGIPVAFRERIFHKFAQADGSNTRTRSGTGLGLSICKQLVLAHGGEIGFTSAYGQGTTFHVDLPLAA